MKKVITCALILSLLGSIGTMCFALSSGGYWEGGHFIEVNDDDWYDPSTEEDDAEDASCKADDENGSISEMEE